MSSAHYDPFGEPVSGTSDAGPARGSAWLARAGAIVFWTAAITIVTARAIWFDPDWSAHFGQALAYARSLVAPFGV